jgi:signal peptide peptidase SppA
MQNKELFFSQFSSEPWAMEPNRLSKMFAWIDSRKEAKTNNTAPLVDVQSKKYNLKNGVAEIKVEGLILKSVPEWFADFGLRATGTEDTQKAISDAVNDSNVNSISLLIDSPGGTVSGVQELADYIYSVKDTKPINAIVSDLCASAAYWIASQTGSIAANETAIVGSIGVYSVITDMSKMANDIGLKVYAIRSAEAKGGVIPGTEAKQVHLDNEQELVNGIAQMFFDAVARGRGMNEEQVTAVSNGKVWLANDSVKMGLIDSVIGQENKKQKQQPKESSLVAVNKDAPVSGAIEKVLSMEDKTVKVAVTETAPAIDIEALKKELEEAKCQAEQSKKQLLENNKTICADIISTAFAAGLMTVDQKVCVEQFAESIGFDSVKVKSFCSTFKPLVHAVQQSSVPVVENAETEKKENNFNPDELQAMKLFGNSDADIKAFGNVQYITWDHKKIGYDGKEIEVIQ